MFLNESQRLFKTKMSRFKERSSFAFGKLKWFKIEIKLCIFRFSTHSQS